MLVCASCCAAADRKGTDRVQLLRCEFWEKIKEISFKNLIFIDESGVNLAMVRLYASSLKGQRAKGPKPTCAWQKCLNNWSNVSQGNFDIG
ncbi:hypothetical protein Q5692_08790 [Microcoleus sp. C2C3]|uniref:hypothetical protein n=1 Tax=unclassified Microcoleus TaxID=2642155 RepID=UPI002FD0CB42